jgi:chemotaxis protein methyltransferase CheR
MLDVAGIQLGHAKRTLVSSRLASRLRKLGLSTYGDYYRLISGGSDAVERQTAVDLLTTNETYFFREPKHFDFLRELLGRLRPTGQPFRVWSAACSSGEEPYSIAMVLADRSLGRSWEILASDLSTRVLAKARLGHYPQSRASQIPAAYLRRFCLKGIGPEEGTMLVDEALTAQVEFRSINLKEPFPEVGSFDVIFLRNVMFYFDSETKASVAARLTERLRPGGHLFIGHSETLNGTTRQLRAVAPAIYQKPMA